MANGSAMKVFLSFLVGWITVDSSMMSMLEISLLPAWPSAGPPRSSQSFSSSSSLDTSKWVIFAGWKLFACSRMNF